MNKKLISTGKAKKIYATNKKNEIIMEFTDHITAFNGIKDDYIDKKGEINLKITVLIFKYLSDKGIPTHILKKLNDSSLLCQSLKIIPLEVIMRNYAKGSIVKRYGLTTGQKFSKPILEFCYKDDKLNDPLIMENIIFELKLCTKEELKKVISLTTQINDLMISLFDKMNLRMVDFKLEFGINSKGEVLLADELSPDSMRIEDLDGNIYDKDLYRNNIGDVMTGYGQFYNKLKKALEK